MRFLLVLIAALLFSAPLFLAGHTEQTVGTAANPVPIFWSGAAVTYRVNQNTSASLANVLGGSDPLTAVRNAFSSLDAESNVTITDGGTTSATTAGNDGTNLVTFIDNATNRSLVGGAIGVNIATFNPNTGALIDADIIFNPAQTFSTTGSANAFDVESVALHEGGHFLGQNHSPFLSSIMYPFLRGGTATARTLTEDDRSGLRALYPPPAMLLTGGVSGRVIRPGGSTVFGAHVVLQDAITGEATTGTVSRPDGRFDVPSLPQGIYYVYLEPLDEPFTPGALSGGLWSSATMDDTFRTSFLGGTTAPATIISVQPGQTLALGDLTVDGPAPTLDVRGIAVSASPTTFSGYSSLHVSVTPGSTQFVAIGGPGLNTLPDSAFSIDSPLLTLGPSSSGAGSIPSFGDGFKIFPLAVAAGTPAGGYSVRVVSGGELSIMTGAIRVERQTPATPLALEYGRDCGGSVGAVRLVPVGLPSVGNASFALDLTNTQAGQTGFYLIGLQPAALVAPPCTIHVDVLNLLIPFPGISFPLAAGTTRIPTPIPNDPGLAGFRLYVQCVATDPGATLGIGASNGVLLLVQ